MGMKRYLNQITAAEAIRIVRGIRPVNAVYAMPVTDAVGQVLAESLYAQYAVPEVAVAAMDGFAIRAAETSGASEQRPVVLRSFVRVNTGNVVPKDFDAVVRVEDAWFEEGDSVGEISVRKSVNPATNVRQPGEDVKEGQLILPAGAVIRPFDVGAIAAYGITHVRVRLVRVGILPTGTELVEPGEKPVPGQVVESNTMMAEAYLRQFGVKVTRYAPVEDNPVLIRGALERVAAESDVIIVSAGSSAGTKDFTATVIGEMGNLIFHGVAMKPAKPAMFGMIGKKPVFGLPGYPLSAQTVLRLFVSELLEAWGWKGPERRMVTVRLGDSISSEGGIDEYSLQAVGRVGDHYSAIPQSRGASVQMTGVRANAIVQIPHGVEGYEAGEEVAAVLTVPKAELDRTVLVAGVYDSALEPLMEMAMREGIRIRFGSFSGISGVMLLLKRSCHVACVTEEEDLMPLAGRQYVTVRLGERVRMVVWRSDLEEPLVGRVVRIAESKEFRDLPARGGKRV